MVSSVFTPKKSHYFSVHLDHESYSHASWLNLIWKKRPVFLGLDAFYVIIASERNRTYSFITMEKQEMKINRLFFFFFSYVQGSETPFQTLYKNMLLKNTVEWNTPRKIQGLMGFWTCTGEKKEDICKEFERESPILAYTKRRKKIAYLFSSLVFPSL